VVGVECLICLDDPATSLKEIHRILKPGGTLTIAEFRLSAISVARRRLAAMGAAAGLDLVRMKDETAKARRSILENAGRRLARTARIPWPFRGWARELAAVPGTARYEQWERGHRCYYIAQFKRPK
jgi:ubiquinone/menaquinone biosynthesis C-methylase UbiE